MQYTQAMENMMVARISLLLEQPFFGTLAMKLQMVEVEPGPDQKMKTAAVDGRKFWFNPGFTEKLDPEQRKFLMCHEVMHCALDHLYRRSDRDPKIWGSAADLVINASLVEQGLKMPPIGEYDKEKLNWTAEDVYDEMIKNGDGPTNNMDIHPGEEGFPGEGMGALSEDEAQGLSDEWKDAIIQAASAAAGNVPAALRRLIEQITEPKMDWKQMLQMHLQACVRTDYTWMKPNKRTFGCGITLPSMDMDDMVKVAIAVDCSGSVSPDMLRDFLSEVKGIMDAFSGYEIHIACFDTQVYDYACLTGEDEFEDYVSKVTGGGGTDFMCWWHWAQEQEWIGDVRKILFFTDGYPYGDWGIDGVCETLWIVHGSREQAPFGVTVFYEDHLDK